VQYDEDNTYSFKESGGPVDYGHEDFIYAFDDDEKKNEEKDDEFLFQY